VDKGQEVVLAMMSLLEWESKWRWFAHSSLYGALQWGVLAQWIM